MRTSLDLIVGESALMDELPLDLVMHGDCRAILATLPAQSVDLIFADPPYNLQLQQELLRPNMTRVNGVDDEWDHFDDFASYDAFTVEWLTACRRVLKDTGTIWVMGSYHNIFRVGKVMQDLGFWLLNDIIWRKTNPMPQFRGVRFANAHETLLWAKKSRTQKRYTFNYHAMKSLNEDKQMRSDWEIPLCTGAERLKLDGQKLHAAQKPEALLYRVLLASSMTGETVLDPFFGTGTSGAVARRLGRHFIGIERDEMYVELARERIAAVTPAEEGDKLFATPAPRLARRVPIGVLLERGLLQPGAILRLGRGRPAATLMADGSLVLDGIRGSIHAVGAHANQQPSCNGWQTWYYEDPDSGELILLDTLRSIVRQGLEAEAQAAG